MKRLIQFELRKLFSRRLTQAAILVLLLFSLLSNLSLYQGRYAYDGDSQEDWGRKAVEIDKAVAKKYEGILTDKTVARMMEDFKIDEEKDLRGANAIYVYENATQSAAFLRFAASDGSWNGKSVFEVFGQEKIKIGFIDGWMSVSQNLIRISLLLAVVVILMTAPVYCGEYAGVDALIFTSRYGRTLCPAAKAAAGLLAAFTVTAGTVLLNLGLGFCLYGTEGLDCSILFHTVEYAERGVPFNLTCRTLLAYQVLLAFTGTVSTAAVTLFVSVLSKNPMTALAISGGLYFLSIVVSVAESHPLFRYVALLPVYHAQFCSLMSVEQMKNGLLYAMWALPFAVLLTLACTGLSLSGWRRHGLF